jgi:Caspase domain
MKKIAYCLGINDYDKSGAYGKGSNLNGCIEDTKTMKGIFLKVGFDVITLEDSQCTRERVAQIYADFSRSSEAGDIMALCASAHGTYKMEGNERHTGICLWDGVLWDSDHKSHIASIPKNRGLILFSDTCYSQDNWKVALPTDMPRLKLKYLPAGKTFNSDSEQQFTLKYSRTLKIVCNVIAYTSSTFLQPSYDMGAIGGLFTISFAKAFAAFPVPNYFAVFNRTAKIMAQSGLPQNPIFDTQHGTVWKWTYRNFGD